MKSKFNKKIILAIVVLLIIFLAIVLSVNYSSIKLISKNQIAYEEILEKGYKGSQAEFIASLACETFTYETDSNSAYELATNNGYEGSFTDWLTLLTNCKDEDFFETDYEKTSYEIAVEYSFTGSEEEWLEIFRNANYSTNSNNQSAYDLAVKNGFDGTVSDFIDSLKGQALENGKTPYDMAKKGGFKGTKSDFVIAISVVTSDKYNNGKSAFQLAQYFGYEDDLSSWLYSLVNEESFQTNVEKTSYKLAVENDFKEDFLQWIIFLMSRNEKHQSPYDILCEKGYVDTLQSWLELLVTFDGEIAYEESTKKGYRGSYDEWISLISGKEVSSVYEKANSNGYVGTEKEFYDTVIDVVNGGKSKNINSAINDVFVDENNHLIIKMENDFSIDHGKVNSIDSEKTTITAGNSTSADKDNDQIKYCYVMFEDYDGTILKTQIIQVGTSAQSPIDPSREGYKFIGWNKSYENVKENTVIVAMYEKILSPTIIVDKVQGSPGDKDVQVNVKVENNPGILGMKLTINFDENALTLKSVENGSAVSKVLTLSRSKTLEDGANFTWDGIEISEEQIKDGEILILHFDINESAVLSDVPISFSYEEGDIVNNNLENISFDIVNGSIKIYE